MAKFATNANTKLAKKKGSTLRCVSLKLLTLEERGPMILRKVKNSWQHMVSCGTQGKECIYYWCCSTDLYVMWLHVLISWVYLYVPCTCSFALSLFFIQPLYVSFLHFHFFFITKPSAFSIMLNLLFTSSTVLQIQGFHYKIIILICIRSNIMVAGIF